MTGPITIYSTSYCGPCRQLRKFLDYKQIPYELHEIDDDEPKKHLVVEMTGRFIMPTVQIGQRWISGYRPADIMEAIGNE